MFDLKEYLRERSAAFDTVLDGVLPTDEVKPETIHEAMRYSLFCGGKRLRPILCMAACELCGGRVEDAHFSAAALECLHTYTLIHDDLPAMDDDDLRRGRPTSHKVYGDAMAILAGDALLTFSFELLARRSAPAPYEPCRLIAELARASGSQGVIGGQVVDMQSEGCEPDAETLDYIHMHKTAFMIEAACRMGCVAAGGTEEQLAALSVYGRAVGLAFQIVDDILDVVSDEATLGKPIGSDADNGKMTYVALYGIEASKSRALELVGEAQGALSGFDADTRPLCEVAEYMAKRIH